MKAIILERRGDYAAALCEDGTIVKTRHDGKVGERIELSAEIVTLPKRKKRWMRSVIAAALALAITGGAFGYMGTTASAYVSLDVEDSSIELSVNHFGRVIAVRAMDESGKALAQSLGQELHNRRADDAIGRAMDRLHGEGYFRGDADAVLVGIAADNPRQAAELTQAAEHSVGEARTLYLSEVSRAERDHAQEQHMSAGRFGFERDHGAPPPPLSEKAPENSGAAPEPYDSRQP